MKMSAERPSGVARSSLQLPNGKGIHEKDHNEHRSAAAAESRCLSSHLFLVVVEIYWRQHCGPILFLFLFLFLFLSLLFLKSLKAGVPDSPPGGRDGLEAGKAILEFLESLLPLWRILEEGEHPMNKPEGVANPGAPLGNILESQVEAVIPAVDIHRPWEVLLQDGLDPSMFARHVGSAIIRLPLRFFPSRLNLIMLSLMMDASVSPVVEEVE